MKIIQAAELVNIPYENAKAIYRIYKNEGRCKKKIAKKRVKDYDKFMKMYQLAADRYTKSKNKDYIEGDDEKEIQSNDDADQIINYDHLN